MLCGCVTSPTRQGSRRDETKRDSSGRLGRPRSPPVRGRGLKRLGLCVGLADVVSPPVRGRGLKQRFARFAECVDVAPRAGARIETQSGAATGHIAPTTSVLKYR